MQHSTAGMIGRAQAVAPVIQMTGLLVEHSCPHKQEFLSLSSAHWLSDYFFAPT